MIVHVSLQSVRRYRKDVPRDPLSSWRTFLESHRPQIWASDFFTVHTLWFQTLYVSFFVAHDRRTMMHLNITLHPTAEWVWRQLISATPWRAGRIRRWSCGCRKNTRGPSPRLAVTAAPSIREEERVTTTKSAVKEGLTLVGT